MKRTIEALKLPSVFLLTFITFIACDKEYSTIDSSVLGKENSNFEAKNESLPIIAYNKKLNKVQVSGLSSNLLGVFNDPALGQTTASIITQVTPTSFNPKFDTNPVIDSVVLRIPYYSRATGTETKGGNTYNLYTIQDSLHGDPEAEIKLSMYHNNYFLRDFDPSGTNANQTQRYYSYGNINDNGGKNSVTLNGSDIIDFESLNDELIYSNDSF